MTNRYARQTQLPEIGVEGQNKLKKSHILVIGAGGLACPALQYLVGAGIGKITIVDGDSISVSNLHRQILYREEQIGKYKVDMAAVTLKQLNSNCKIITVKKMLTPSNVENLISDVDLVLDCADSFAVSFILSDHCLEKNLPLISASAVGYQGYVGGFCGGAPSLRAVFPNLPSHATTCATGGVLGTAVGLVGTMQAQMAIAQVIGFKPSPMGKILNFNLKTFRTSSFNFNSAIETNNKQLNFISTEMITDKHLVVELRSEDEADKVTKNAIRLKVANVNEDNFLPKQGEVVVFCCSSGIRAWQAARNLQNYWGGDILLIAIGS